MSPIEEWDHRFFDFDAEPANMAPFEQVARIWQNSRNGRRLPPKSGFSMSDFRPWLGSISVNRVEREPFDVLTTLWGTKLREIYGAERTGTRLSTSAEERGLTEKDLQFWHRVALTPCIGLASGALTWKDRNYISLTVIYLPFGEDGDTCDTIVTVALTRG